MSNTDVLEANQVQVIEAYKGGVSTCELGRKYNCSNALVWKFLDKQGVIQRKRLASEYTEEIITLYEGGMSGTDVAKQLSLSQPSVSRILTKHKVSRYAPQQYNYKEIADSYKNGQSSTQIAEQLNTYDSNINRILRLQDVEIRDGRKYHFNEEFFHTINSEAKAYFLGMLLADGYNDQKRHSVKLSLIDKDVIEKFKISVGFDGMIHEILPRKITCHVQYSIELSSIILSESLKQYGCDTDKTHNLKFPSSDLIPDNLMRHFVRGFFDGDGTIGFRNKKKQYYVKIIGTEHFINGLTTYLQDKVVSHWSVFPTTNTSFPMLNMSCMSKDGVRSFLDYLYKDATVYMDRKHNRYLEFCEV